MAASYQLPELAPQQLESGNIRQVSAERLNEYTEYRHYPCHLQRLQWIFRRIQAYAEPEKPLRILDVGCGTGNLTIPLGLLPNAQVYGIDPHQPSVAQAAAACKLPNVHFEHELLDERFPLGQFDFVILSEVLEHIGGYPQMLTCLTNGMKPGSHLLLTFPNGRGPFEASQQPLYWLRRQSWGPGLVRRVKRLLGKREPYSMNEGTPHVNFFRTRFVREELPSYGFRLVGWENAFVFAPSVETYLPFVPLRHIASWDQWLAQRLPHSLASGWYLHLTKP